MELNYFEKYDDPYKNLNIGTNNQIRTYIIYSKFDSVRRRTEYLRNIGSEAINTYGLTITSFTLADDFGNSRMEITGPVISIKNLLKDKNIKTIKHSWK